jgi:MoxR-like ATPase
MSSKNQDWRIFRGEGKQLGKVKHLPPAPPWRQFRHTIDPQNLDERTLSYWQQLQDIVRDGQSSRDGMRGRNFRLPDESKERNKIIDAVNAALYLRRPLLVTGKPGTGKTSLAYAIAYELQLGPVLKWPITTRSTLEEGLYQYDALGRLQAIQQENVINQDTLRASFPQPINTYNDIGEFIRLGPLGTAFLPAPYPRVLLIDEIDKSDINLPNDLLNLLEEGEFEIPVLKRLVNRDRTSVEVNTADGLKVPLEGGKVLCQSFPMILMTSNDERDFPPAFLRRCLQVKMPQPTEEDLITIVTAHLGEEIGQQVTDLISEFARSRDRETVSLATDQLLNAVFMRTHNAETEDLKALLFTSLSNIESNR